RVCPQGARGGYAFLVETEDFSVKLLGERIQHRPGVYIEVRSHALHTHPGGPQGACEAALAWVRERLFADQREIIPHDAIAFATPTPPRPDTHIVGGGVYPPPLSGGAEELPRFIRPGKIKGPSPARAPPPPGYISARAHTQARLYNKTRETAEKANDGY